ncbi:unnamed protein product, partial [Rotaria sp. Silwood1]
MGFGTSIRIVVMEPDIIAHVLAHSNAQDFIRTSDNGVSLKHLIGERNLVMTNGLYHDRARQMLNPAFHFDNVKSMISTMNNQTARIIDELFVLSNGKNFIDLQNEFQRLTLTILVSTVFGTNFETTVNVKEIASKGFTEVLDAVQYRTYALHRDADLWSRSLEFDYTRWMRHPITGIKPKLAHPYCYLPFGAGPRNCIAQNFALVEAKIILAMLVQRCDFEMEPGQKIIPDIRLTMRSKYGLRAK